MSPKGRKRPQDVGPVPDLDEAAADKSVQKYYDGLQDNEKPFSFGVYAAVKKSSAIRGKQLADLHNFVTPLLQCIPSARVKPLELKALLERAIARNPTKPPVPGMPMANYMNVLITQVLIILEHCRRLKSPKHFRWAVERQSDDGTEAILKEYVAIMADGVPPADAGHMSDGEGWPAMLMDDGIDDEVADESAAAAGPVAEADEWPAMLRSPSPPKRRKSAKGPPAPPRVLHRMDSLDDDGWPKALVSNPVCNIDLMERAKAIAKKPLPGGRGALQKMVTKKPAAKGADGSVTSSSTKLRLMTPKKNKK